MNLPIMTDRLIITELKESMIDTVYLSSHDEDNRRFVPDEVFETIEIARETVLRLISFYSQKDKPLVYAITLNDGEYIGHIQAVPIDLGWEIGYHIAKTFTGRGYATEAVSAFIIPIMNHLGISKLYGVCHTDNIASRRVLEKCGFILDFEGTGFYQGSKQHICRYISHAEFNQLEKMDDFFNTRADLYDSHMINDLKLDEFYEAIDNCVKKPIKRLLDLGCGTGLELERLFIRFPDMKVTGIDMAEEMLKKLELKYPDKKVNLICGSYFDVDFEGMYDCVLSTYSLHHFTEDDKLSLYRKIYNSLNNDGVFIFGDYTVSTIEQQCELFSANEDRRREQGLPDGVFYHFDTPFTPENEIRIMKTAGFVDIQVLKHSENTSIIIAKR